MLTVFWRETEMEGWNGIVKARRQGFSNTHLLNLLLYLLDLSVYIYLSYKQSNDE